MCYPVYVSVCIPSLCASINEVIDGAIVYPLMRSFMVQAALYVPFSLCVHQ